MNSFIDCPNTLPMPHHPLDAHDVCCTTFTSTALPMNTYTHTLCCETTSPTGDTYMPKIIGPRTEPWGTPDAHSNTADFSDPTAICWVHSVTNDRSQSRATSATSTIESCASDVSRWFVENALLLNPTKTTAVIFGTSQWLSQDSITMCPCRGSWRAVRWLRQTARSDARLNTVLRQARHRCNSLLSLPHPCTASYMATADNGTAKAMAVAIVGSSRTTATVCCMQCRKRT